MIEKTVWEEIKLLVLDVDGVMTDGSLIFSSDGSEIKSFSALDGIGIKGIQKIGIDVAIISARESVVTTRRAKDLGIDLVYQGKLRKTDAYHTLKEMLNLYYTNICYIGDDDIDVELIRLSGVGVSVPNGTELAKTSADIITKRSGGVGAVRDICDSLLSSHDTSIFTLFSI